MLKQIQISPLNSHFVDSEEFIAFKGLFNNGSLSYLVYSKHFLSRICLYYISFANSLFVSLGRSLQFACEDVAMQCNTKPGTFKNPKQMVNYTQNSG